MPLKASKESPSTVAESLTSSASTSSPAFLVVYASVVDGKMWCGDCRVAEPLVEKYLGSRSEEVKVIYAGNRAEWRSLENVWRKEPFSIEKLPTVVKVTATGKWLRLVEDDVYDVKKLQHFIEK